MDTLLPLMLDPENQKNVFRCIAVLAAIGTAWNNRKIHDSKREFKTELSQFKESVNALCPKLDCPLKTATPNTERRGNYSPVRVQDVQDDDSSGQVTQPTN